MPANAWRITFAASGARRRGDDRPVEVVRFANPRVEHRIEVREGSRAVARRPVRKPEPPDGRLAAGNRAVAVRGHLRAGVFAADRVGAAVDDEVVDGVLDGRAGIRCPEQPLGIRLVLGEEQRQVAVDVEPALTERRVRGSNRGVVPFGAANLLERGFRARSSPSATCSGTRAWAARAASPPRRRGWSP